jgi:predicted dehydrogenase
MSTDKTAPIRTALCGLGRIALSDHLPRLTADRRFRLVAVADPLEERCREICEHYSGLHALDNIEELLKQEEIELLVLASPTNFHADQAVMALEKGVNVFCDKPVASNAMDAERMFDTAKRFSTKLMVYQPRRVFPEAKYAREIIHSGKIGRVFQIKIFAGSYSRRNDWQAIRANGGGMLLNYGAHYVDQVSYMLGEKLSIDSCIIDHIVTLGDAEDVVKILLNSKSGVLVDIDISQASAIQPYSMLIYGKYGAAMLTPGGIWRIVHCDPVSLHKLELQTGLAAADRKYSAGGEYFTETEMKNPTCSSAAEIFYDNIYCVLRENAEAIVNPEEAISLMRLLDTAEKLARGKEEKC